MGSGTRLRQGLWRGKQVGEGRMGMLARTIAVRRVDVLHAGSPPASLCACPYRYESVRAWKHCGQGKKAQDRIDRRRLRPNKDNMKKITNLLIVCSLALAGAVMAQQPTPESQPPGKKPDKKAPAEMKPQAPRAPKADAPAVAPKTEAPVRAPKTEAPVVKDGCERNLRLQHVRKAGPAKAGKEAPKPAPPVSSGTRRQPADNAAGKEEAAFSEACARRHRSGDEDGTAGHECAACRQEAAVRREQEG